MAAGAPLLRRFPDHDALAQALADSIARHLRRAIAERGAASLLVPGGRTPIAFFEHLSRETLDWPRVTLGLTDERWSPPTDAASNEHLLRTHLLRNEATSAQLISLWSDASNATDGAARAWQNLNAMKRPFDAVVLGMGEDGHIASLFPDDPASMQALRPDADPACIATLAPSAPMQRMSLNLAALLQTRALYLLVTGEPKWSLLSRELNPATTWHLPVQALARQAGTALAVFWSP